MSESYYETPPRGSSGALIVALSFLVALIGAAGLLLLTRALSAPPSDAAAAKVQLRVVPDLEGLSVESARELANKGGIALHLLGGRPEGRVDNAKIVRQEPLPGSLVAEGAPLRAWLVDTPEGGASSGGRGAPVAAAKLPAPKVVGLNLLHASRILGAAGLSIGELHEAPGGTTAPGNIIAQEPAANTEISQGTPVSLTVARAGADPVALAADLIVPKVARLSRDAARDRLEELGLRVRFDTLFTPGVSSGHVVRTRPKAGSPVKAGASILVILSE